VWLLLDPDHPAVHLGDTLALGLTESKAYYFSRGSCVNTRETVEDSFEMFDRDTNIIIAHEHFQHLLRYVSPVAYQHVMCSPYRLGAPQQWVNLTSQCRKSNMIVLSERVGS
jgi:hypothetical protein